MELKFKTERVSERITRIFGFNTELMYLVEGEREAALLDTGSGFGSLKDCIAGLTDKPLTVLCTHGHTDHALGAAEFERVYLNPADRAVYAVHSGAEFRAVSGRMWPDFDRLEAGQILPALPFESFAPLRAGDVFDLGGISVETLPCPGHTPGSLAMLIPGERALLLGDACNTCTFLFDEFSSSVEDYRRALITLKAMTDGRYDKVLLSHGDGAGGTDMIDSVIAVCDDILTGRADDCDFEFLGNRATLAKAITAGRRRADGGTGNIVYNKKHI